jgi:hypothetical protein
LGKEQKRETHNVFDLTIKYLLQDTNSSNVVYLINALFERVYPVDSPVSFEKTESVQKQGNKLKPYYSDMLVNLAGDDFAIEFQIGDDEIIGLRIFEYGFRYAHKNKRIYENGGLIELNLPEGCVIFWESGEKTPDKIMVRLQEKACNKRFDYEVKVFKMSEQSLEALEEKRLLVLLPFCLLKFRKELRSKQINPEKRRAVAELEKRLIEELEAVLTRGVEEGYINDTDCIMILESIAQMHKELYDEYEEFQEASMVLDDGIKLRWKDHERQLNQQWKDHEQKIALDTKKQTETRIIELWKQGYTTEEVEKLLAEEDRKI